MRLSLLSFFIFLTLNLIGQTEPNPKVEQVNPYAEKPLKSNQFLYFDLERMEFDFNEFSSVFSEKNIELLESPKLFWGLEYGVQYHELFFSVQFSLGRQTQTLNDSIDGRVNYNRLGLAVGYYLVNSKKIQLIPKFELFYNSLGLKNFSSTKEIPLVDYLENPNFDLDFSQYTGQIGMEVNWKFPYLSTNPTQPFLIGIHSGYNFTLGKTSLQSENNTLKTSQNIDLANMTYGFHFTIYL